MIKDASVGFQNETKWDAFRENVLKTLFCVTDCNWLTGWVNDWVTE